MKILLWDYSEEFRSWFDQELNPDIDPRVIGINDRIKIRYRRSSGMIDSMRANTIANKIEKYGHIVEAAKGNFQCIMDLPIFKDWFKQELNPNIDPYSISISAEWPHIQYVRIDGSNAEISPRRFVSIIKKNGKFVEPKKCQRCDPQWCINDDVFMKKFDTELNKHINFKLLKSNDKNTILSFVDKSENIRTTTAHSYYLNVKRNGGKHADNSDKRIHYAIENPYFCSFFKQELNPNIDLSRIRCSDSKTVLHYVMENGNEGYIKPKTFFKNIERNNGIFVESKRNIKASKTLAIDDPSFKKWYEPELNPDIDIKKLSKYANAKIRHHDADGDIYSIKLSNFFRIIEKNGGLFVEPKRKNLETPVHGYKKDTAMANPLFEKTFNTVLNAEIDLLKIMPSHAHPKLKYYNDNHEIDMIRPVDFFNNVKRNNGVFIKGKHHEKTISGETDAATKDPEIELFWDWKKNSKKPTELSPYSGREYYFVCPYCGHEFTKRMKNIAGKSPKCPQCHDGFQRKEQSTKMPSDVAFLLRSLAPKEG